MKLVRIGVGVAELIEFTYPCGCVIRNSGKDRKIVRTYCVDHVGEEE